MSDHPLTAAATDVDSAIDTRMSARAFLPKPVPREVLADLLSGPASAAVRRQGGVEF